MTGLSQAPVSDKISPQQFNHLPRPRSWYQSLLTNGQIDEELCNQTYPGSGTSEDPYLVSFLYNDRQDPMGFSKQRKWTIAITQTISTFALTFASSVYVSGIPAIMQRFSASKEVTTLGLSLFVLGFAIGPLFWAPLSEDYGRKSIFVISYTAFVAFNIAATCSPNITGLLIFRFLASASGSSAMTNAGGVIVDLLSKSERGMATSLFSAAPYLGPAFGPVVGGFLGERHQWRWILGLVAIMTGVVCIITTLTMRETYAPFILRTRATALCRTTGSVYVSRLDAGKPHKTLLQKLSISLTRPLALLFREPIVFLTSLYVAIVYGTLYMFVAGFGIVFQKTRGWSQGIAGLPFLSIAVGVCVAILAAGIDSRCYGRLCAAAEAKGGVVEPETRLRSAMIGAIILPIGLFLFAWTTYPSVHWIAPISGAVLFSCGLVMISISLIGYLVDSYTIYAASVLAANSLFRSVFGAAFPLFTTQMYDKLGVQWASAVPAFLVLGCLPFPFLFYKYGEQIRLRCKYAAEAARISEMIRHRHVDGGSP